MAEQVYALCHSSGIPLRQELLCWPIVAVGKGVVQSREDRIFADDRDTPLLTQIFQELLLHETGISYDAFPHTLEGSHVVSRVMDRSAP